MSAAPPASPAPPASADALAIAGLVPLSSVDWPGKLVATVFTQGCPWACPYCHNHQLIPTRTPGQVPFAQVRALLEKRRGLLDGVVFSGGEALRQSALAPAAEWVKNQGFQVGLHSAGPFPAALARLLEAGLVDWIGLDIKSLPGAHYEAVAGRPGAGEKAYESLEIALTALREGRLGGLEIRTTVFPDPLEPGPLEPGPTANPAAPAIPGQSAPGTSPEEAVEIARRVREAGAPAFALQVARELGAPAAYQGTRPATPAWIERTRAAAAAIKTLGFKAFAYRD